jgi:uncharacterized RDD family membrane protein YckC
MEDPANPYAAPQSLPAAAGAGASRKKRLISARRRLRFANLIIDQFMLVVIAFAIWFVCVMASEEFGYRSGLEFLQRVPPVLAEILVTFGYYVILEATTSRTVGKFITGTIVVNDDGGKPTFGQIFGRSAARWIPLEAFSFFSQERTGVHDRLANTYVIKTPRRTPAK